MTTEQTAEIGHNNPPAYDPEKFEALRDEARAFAKEHKELAGLTIIEDDVTEMRVADALNGARALHKRIEDLRKAEKAPHADAAKAVDLAFKPMANGINSLCETMKRLTGARLAEKQRQIDEERRRAEAEAAEARRLAEMERRAAEERGDALRAAEAAEAEKMAEKAAKAASKPATASAQGAKGRKVALRTYRRAVLVNPFSAFKAYRDRPELRELLERFATEDLKRTGEIVPGFDVVEEKRAA